MTVALAVNAVEIAPVEPTKEVMVLLQGVFIPVENGREDCGKCPYNNGCAAGTCINED